MKTGARVLHGAILDFYCRGLHFSVEEKLNDGLGLANVAQGIGTLNDRTLRYCELNGEWK